LKALLYFHFFSCLTLSYPGPYKYWLGLQENYWRMRMISHLDEFLKFVKNNPEGKCHFTSIARAAEIEKAPRDDISLPGGTVSLFDNFLVFLTLSSFKERSVFAGLVDTYMQEMKPLISFYKTLNKPDMLMVAEFATKILTYFTERAQRNAPIDIAAVRAKFEGTSSIVLPTHNIQTVTYHQWQKFKHQSHIKIITTDSRTVIICPDSGFEAQQASYWTHALVKGWIPNPIAPLMLTKEKWHPEFVEMLENIAKKNQVCQRANAEYLQNVKGKSDKSEVNPKFQLRSAMSTLSRPKAIFQQTPLILLRNRPARVSVHEVEKITKERGFFDIRSNPEGRFYNDLTENGNNTVTDRVTGLTWQKGGSTERIPRRKKVWSTSSIDATSYIWNLNRERFGDISAWRLPTLEEVMSLLEPTKKEGLYIDPIFERTQDTIWTSDDEDAFGVVWLGCFSEGRACTDGPFPKNRFVKACSSEPA